MAGGIVTVELSWPAKELSPNARPHYMKLHGLKKQARGDAYWSTKVALGRNKFDHDGTSDIILRQVAHPPDLRDRDRDNLDHSLKAARDGIAQALGINDKHFRPTGIEWAEPVPGGKVIVSIGGGE